MRLALDTNVLAYAEGVNGAGRRADAIALVERLPQASVVLPVQALGELFHVLTRKAGRSRDQAREAVLGWTDSYAAVGSSIDAMHAAAGLAAAHRLGIWDALILSVSARAGCRLLLSEDLQHGFSWDGLTVVNPFLPELHPLLAAALGSIEE